MVYGLTLKLRNATKANAGKYTCVISNSYGVLTKTIRIKIGKKMVAKNTKVKNSFSLILDPGHPDTDPISSFEATEEMTLKQIFQFQSKIYESLIKLAQDKKQILGQLREMEF